jgi:hypothetical protein
MAEDAVHKLAPIVCSATGQVQLGNERCDDVLVPEKPHAYQREGRPLWSDNFRLMLPIGFLYR